MRPLISLIVCTRNRAAVLSPALASFVETTFSRPYEIIIVDNGSTDATPDVLRSFSEKYPDFVRVVTEPTPGLCRSRNAALKIAASDIVVFTDDDCYLAPDFFDQILACFAESEIAYLGGRVLLFDAADLPITLQEKNHPTHFKAGQYITPGSIHGANFAFRRMSLQAIGAFDVCLGAGTSCRSGGDSEIVVRMSAAGLNGAYDPRPLVHHHHRRRTQEDAQSILDAYAVGRGAFFLKGLLHRQTRWMVAQAIARRLIGHLIYRRKHEFFMELKGASNYLKARQVVR